MGRYQSFIDKQTEDIIKKIQKDLSGYYDKNFLDLDAVCTELGIELLEGTFEDNLSGALILKENKQSIIVNRNHHINRRRYTIGHELGHFFANKYNSFVAKDYLERHDGVIKDYSLFNRKEDHAEDDYQAERQANIIAAHILMPEDNVKRCIENGLELIDMAEEFGVSEQAMSYRLKSMGFESL